MSKEKLYAVKNDESEWLDQDRLWGPGAWATPCKDEREKVAKCYGGYGGHVVELTEAPTKVVVSQDEAEMLTEAKTATYPAEYITRHSCLKQGSEDRLMRAYVIGWTVEKPKRWNVKVPHTEHVWYYKPLNADLLTISDKELCSEFTEAEIEHYGLQDCEKEEVIDDDDD